MADVEGTFCYWPLLHFLFFFFFSLLHFLRDEVDIICNGNAPFHVGGAIL